MRAKADTIRALAAAHEILDGRDPVRDRAAIMVTLEHLVSTILLIGMEGDTRKAALLMTEGLAPGVEARLAQRASKKR